MVTVLPSDDAAREALAERDAILGRIDAIQQGNTDVIPGTPQSVPSPDAVAAESPQIEQGKESAQQRINRLDGVFQETFLPLNRALDEALASGDESRVAPAVDAIRTLIAREQQMLQQEVESARDDLGSAVGTYGESAAQTLEADDAFRRWTNALNLLNTWHDSIRPQLESEVLIADMRARKEEVVSESNDTSAMVAEAPKSRTERLLEAAKTLRALREAMLKRIDELNTEEKKLKDESKKMEIAQIMSTM